MLPSRPCRPSRPRSDGWHSRQASLSPIAASRPHSLQPPSLDQHISLCRGPQAVACFPAVAAEAPLPPSSHITKARPHLPARLRATGAGLAACLGGTQPSPAAHTPPVMRGHALSPHQPPNPLPPWRCPSGTAPCAYPPPLSQSSRRSRSCARRCSRHRSRWCRSGRRRSRTR